MLHSRLLMRFVSVSNATRFAPLRLTLTGDWFRFRAASGAFERLGAYRIGGLISAFTDHATHRRGFA